MSVPPARVTVDVVVPAAVLLISRMSALMLAVPPLMVKAAARLSCRGCGLVDDVEGGGDVEDAGGGGVGGRTAEREAAGGGAGAAGVEAHHEGADGHGSGIEGDDAGGGGGGAGDDADVHEGGIDGGVVIGEEEAAGSGAAAAAFACDGDVCGWGKNRRRLPAMRTEPREGSANWRALPNALGVAEDEGARDDEIVGAVAEEEVGGSAGVVVGSEAGAGEAGGLGAVAETTRRWRR